MKLSKLIRILFYILAIVLPVQTVLVKLFTVRFGFSDWIALWKEAVILIIIVYLLLIIFQDFYTNFQKLTKQKFVQYFFKHYFLILIFFLLNIVIIINSFVFNIVSLQVFAYGYRFELFWLGFFAIVATYLFLPIKNNQILSTTFVDNLKKSIFIGFGLSAVFTFITLLFGANEVLTWVGFGSVKEGSLVAQSVTCNVIDFGSSTCRVSGSFASPNHFAGYLLLVAPVFLINFIDNYLKWRKYHLLHKRNLFSKNSPIWNLLLISLLILILAIFLLLTVSRFAWLGMMIFIGLILIYFGHQFKIYNQKITKFLLGLLLFIPVLIGTVGINLDPQISAKFLPTAIAKPSSTIEHYRHTMASLEVLTTSGRYLQGFGLGSSGSVATEQYQDLESNNIYKDHKFIALDWFLTLNRITIPENWYISVFLNGGLFYFLLYISLVLYPILVFYKFFKSKQFTLDYLKMLLIGTGFFSILIGNLFLHIWENQTIAIFWTLLFMLNFSYKKELN